MISAWVRPYSFRAVESFRGESLWVHSPCELFFRSSVGCILDVADVTVEDTLV